VVAGDVSSRWRSFEVGEDVDTGAHGPRPNTRCARWAALDGHDGHGRACRIAI
jgi:hypothetical protein